jgi:hypothetical protein
MSESSSTILYLHISEPWWQRFESSNAYGNRVARSKMPRNGSPDLPAPSIARMLRPRCGVSNADSGMQ